jgi:NAD(P)H-hydrate repair Nnr-like enzyme with NAD(P)H-hydrate dehydratase domain
MPVSPILLPQDQIVRGMLVVRGQYDFAVDGGAISTIAITSGLPIPSGSVIVGGHIDVLTALVGATATIACQVEAANDILTAVAVASWTTGLKNILPAVTSGALTASTAVKTTADRNISIVIATAALTAGKFEVVLLVRPPLA